MQPVLLNPVMHRELQDGDIVNVDVSVYYKVGQSAQRNFSLNYSIALPYTMRCS